MTFLCLQSCTTMRIDTSNAVDQILNDGTDLYFDRLRQIGIPESTSPYLMISQLPEFLTIRGEDFSASISQQPFTGFFGTENTDRESLTLTLEDAISATFEESDATFLTLGPSNCAFTSAIYKRAEDDHYQYLCFDSHSRSRKGTVDPTGKATLIQINSTEGLVLYINNLAQSLFNCMEKTMFEFTPVKCIQNTANKTRNNAGSHDSSPDGPSSASNQCLTQHEAGATSMEKFNHEWTEEYLFALDNKRPVCLVCGATVSVVKKYNIKRHYSTNHGDLDDKCPVGSSLRTKYISKKKSELGFQKSLFYRNMEEAKARVRTSYEVALLLAKRKKPYLDSEAIVKPLFDIIARFIGLSEKQQKMLQEIPLSNNTITRRCNELASDVQQQVAQHVANCSYFSLAIDESNDVCDIAQVAIFVRAINDKFQVIEELLALESLHGTTKGSDLFAILRTCVERNKLDWNKLHSICTDGAPSMTGVHVGCLNFRQTACYRNLSRTCTILV